MQKPSLAITALLFGVLVGSLVSPGSRAAEDASAPVTTSPAAAAPAPVGANATRKKVLRLAVYDLSVEGVEPRIAKLVTNAIVVELRKHKAVSVVSMDELRSMLAYEADKQALGCTEREPCVAVVGEALGVDQLIVGDLSSGAGQSILTLKRIDQAHAQTVDSFTQRLESANGEEFLAAVGPGIAKLFPELALRPGASRGVAPEIALQLNPPPLPAWATVATGVAGGVCLAATVVAGVSALSEQSTFQGLAAQAKTTPVQATLLTGAADRAQGWATTANVLLASTVVVGAAAGVMAPFTDWSGARDAKLE